MLSNYRNYSIKTKILVPTSIILFGILLTYTFVFSKLYVAIKSTAFNNQKVLTQLNKQINNIRFEGDNISDTQLNTLNQLADNYLSLILSTSNQNELEELTIAQSIKDNSESYTQAYHLWLSKHFESQHHSQPIEIVNLEKALLSSISSAMEVVQKDTTEDLESILQYEIIGSIIIYFLILSYVAYGGNLITLPLVKLKGKINRFNEYTLPQNTAEHKGDEIKQLKDSFYIMRADIIQKQQLLEKALTEAKLANKAKDEFLANISHELRTPMLGILGFAELGVSKVDDVDRSKLLKYFSRIHTSGSRLLLLLNNLLDLSKLEANQVEFNIQKNNIKEVLNNALSELIPLINSKSLDIKITDDSQQLIAEFDKQKVHQVVYNLLSNAIKFSPDNSTISIVFQNETIQSGPLSLPAIKLTIADQGIGIPENELISIFEKFSQSSRTKTGAGGTGLGLSICYDICLYHQGKLWAENNPSPEKGARLTFVLPKTFISNKTLN